MNIRNAEFAEDARPIDEACGCYTCRTFTRGYLRHLFKAKEITGLRLATIHNLHFMMGLMTSIRAAIGNGTFGEFRATFLETYTLSNQTVRHEQRRKRAETMRAATA